MLTRTNASKSNVCSTWVCGEGMTRTAPGSISNSTGDSPRISPSPWTSAGRFVWKVTRGGREARQFRPSNVAGT